MKNVKNAFVQSTGIRQIIEVIESKRGMGHRRCPEHLVVVGGSGSGKTTLIEHLKRRYPRCYSKDDECDIVPLVSASFPKDVSTIFMVQYMLKALGDPDYKERDLDSAYEKLWYLLDRCKVEFICFDEFHNIEKGAGYSVSGSAEKFIKDLSNNSKAVQVAFGTERAVKLIEEVDELSNRFDEFLYMPKYSALGGGKAELEAYLKDLSEYADIGNPEFLYSGSMVERIYLATNGLPRIMARLIDRAHLNAKRSSRNKWCYKDFYLAAADFKSSKRQAQIFRLSDKKFSKLIQEGGLENAKKKASLNVIENFLKRKKNFIGAYC